MQNYRGESEVPERLLRFARSSLFHGRVNTAAFATSNTLSPHEIHLNYKSMKELPVHEVKEPF